MKEFRYDRRIPGKESRENLEIARRIREFIFQKLNIKASDIRAAVPSDEEEEDSLGDKNKKS